MACAEYARKNLTRVITVGPTRAVTHDTNVLDTLEVLDARPGWIKCRLKVQPKHANGMGNTHGGCIMTLLDNVTWLSLCTLGIPTVNTVSTNMSCDFARPCGKVGDEIIMEAEPISCGRTLAFTKITFFVNGKQTNSGNHTMAVLMKPEFTHTFSADGKTLIPVDQAKL